MSVRDSSTIAFVTRPTTKIDDSAWSDVWVADVEEGNQKKFFENVGPDSSPRWSPDGRTLAIASKPQPGNTQWFSKLHLFPAEGGEGFRLRVEVTVGNIAGAQTGQVTG